jgi:hypothetical protein
MNENRVRRLVDESITTFNLDLSGLTVLTEAATGYYVLTPIIAAIANANKVYAITRDSRYGSGQTVRDRTLDLARQWNLSDQIEIVFSKNDKRIGEADIVTNLGFVRPLDSPLLNQLKSTAVIPLMWETWEYRSEDIDLTECFRLGIPVLGTNEHHPLLETQRYIGPLALKLLFELDIEVYQSNILVVGSGDFGKYTLQSLKNAKATVHQIQAVDGETLSTDEVKSMLTECDAIVFVEHLCRDLLLGRGGQLTAQVLHELNPGIVIAHIAGSVNQQDIEEVGIPFRPNYIAPSGYMSVALDYLGPHPVINLHTAGLKVGELMARNRLSGADLASTIENCKTNEICQDFTILQKRKYQIPHL